MKKTLILVLIVALSSCGIKKELATAQQENIEIQKKLADLERKQEELKKQNQELRVQNQEYRSKLNSLLEARRRNINYPNRTTVPKVEKIFDYAVEERPMFPGGEEKLMKYISDNLNYPKIAKEKKIEGTVYVAFVVKEDGIISDIKVARGLGNGCDQEAIRVIKSMPKWKPANQRGTPVPFRFVLPIKFKLD